MHFENAVSCILRSIPDTIRFHPAFNYCRSTAVWLPGYLNSGKQKKEEVMPCK